MSGRELIAEDLWAEQQLAGLLIEHERNKHIEIGVLSGQSFNVSNKKNRSKVKRDFLCVMMKWD